MLGAVWEPLNYIVIAVSSLFSLAVLLPCISLWVRRLHDIDKSGWFLFLAFIPLIGGLILLYFAVKEGTKGANIYGPDPKG